MKARPLHAWNVSPREAVAVQRDLAARVLLLPVSRPIRLVAGCDISWDAASGRGFAGAIIYSFPDLEEVERVSCVRPSPFPYVPGLLSFREGPLLAPLLEQLHTEPDVLLFDGQGLAHPRRLGVASHLGLLFDKPSIGCAKSLLVGTHEAPALERGSWTPLVHQGDTVGAALRTRHRVRPLFISPGHRMDLACAIDLVLACGDGFRLPKPTRAADRFVGELRRAHQTGDEGISPAKGSYR